MIDKISNSYVTLQKGLDCMGDIVWCPRCQNPVIQEKEEALRLGHCLDCVYSFCTDCQEPWHQVSVRMYKNRSLHCENTCKSTFILYSDQPQNKDFNKKYD